MAFTIPNRPFAVEQITGLMMPDGIFETSLGKQTINAHVHNDGAAAANVQVYVESVSDPGIVVTPATFAIANAHGGVSHLFTWQADFTTATPGKHLISFIVKTPAGEQRIIKKIFVTKVGYNPGDGSFTATIPEGFMSVQVKDVIRPRDGGKCCREPKQPDDCRCEDKDNRDEQPAATVAKPRDYNSAAPNNNLIDYLARGFKGHDPNFVFCPPWYLPKELHATITPTPPYAGQYGDLPFNDPWWKVILCIIAALLAIGAAIAEAVDGSGDVTVSGGGSGGTGSDDDCCGVTASGGGTSYVAAGLMAGASAVATVGIASDERDIIRKGADHTMPGAGEITLKEELALLYSYIEPIAPGKPFKIKGDWKYTRTTNVKTYTYETSETHQNIHVLSSYHITAPNILHGYKRERFVINGSFFDADSKIITGDKLLVQCFLVGPHGQWRKLIMQDNGVNVDNKANDGIYTGMAYFSANDVGIWKYYVIAQDINHAQPDMEPEEAAKIIGGMVMTNQLTLTFDGGTCAFVPDGHVQIIA